MNRLVRGWLAFSAALALLACLAGPAAASGGGYRTQSQFVHVVDGPADDQPVAIDTTLYLPAGASPAHPVPAVVGAHGFGEDKAALGQLAIFLAGRGYAVLLYTARGFGRSGGEISLDSPDYDVKDVEQLVTWLGTQPEIERDGVGPVVGMMGESYGGAATLLAAAADPAIRVAIPILTWNSLVTSFLPNDVPGAPQPGVFKQAWASVFLGGAGGSFDVANSAPPANSCPNLVPAICQAYVAIADGAPSGNPAPAAALAIMARSSPSTVMAKVKVPTLIIQGESDTLFDLDEAEATQAAVRANGAPARMVWVPGGHSDLAAILSGSTAKALKSAISGWLDRWLKDDPSVPTGGDTFYDPATHRYLAFSASSAAATYHLSAAGQLVRSGARPGALGLANPPGGQPNALSQDPASELLSTVPPFDIPGQNASFTSAPLTGALEVVGSPTVAVTVSSSTPDLQLFAKLYDVAPDTTASLPGGQVAPIRLTGLTPGVTQTVTVRMPAIVQRFAPGDRLRLVLAATDAAYANLSTAAIYSIALGGGTGGALALPTQPLPPGHGHTTAYAVVAVMVVAAAAVIVLTRRRPAPYPLAAGDQPGEAGAAVTIAHLTKQFRGVRAVDDLSLSIGTGQVFGLLGPNGAGKTTTIRMLLGLIYPTGGSCAIFGEQMRPGHPVLARVGTLVEGPKFVPHLSGMDNLRLFWRAGSRSLAEARIEEALVVAGLGDAVHRSVRTYSQGMRQRLGIAQALLGQPELIILDEPTNGLDPQQMFEMRQVIRGLAERGITVLLSSHLLGEVEQVCSHVAIMDRGQLVAAGTVAELIAGSPTVYIEVDDIEAAVPVLEAIGPVQREGPGLVVELRGAPPAAVARALIGAGLGLSSMTPRRHLEDVFMGLIADERAGAAMTE